MTISGEGDASESLILPAPAAWDGRWLGDWLLHGRDDRPDDSIDGALVAGDVLRRTVKNPLDRPRIHIG